MFPSHMYQRSFLGIPLLKNDTSAFTSYILKSYFSHTQTHQLPNYAKIEESCSKVYFSQPAQKLMKKITGFDLEKINRARAFPGPLKAPLYKFMTTEMLEKAQKEAIRKSFRRLQMPPLLPINQGEPEVIDDDPNIIGALTSKFVFTDITYNVSDRKRLVVVREPNGVLRKANAFEKHRMNQLYFPRLGREYRHPRMFKKENLEPLWEKGEFEFILDRACSQFEPDDPEFHEVTFETYQRVNNRKAYDVLRSTRHYGTLVFYLCLNKNLNNLLQENLETNRLDDAILTVKLYTLIHPNCEFKSLGLDPENKLKFLKAFVETEMVSAESLKVLLENMITQAEKDEEQQLANQTSEETEQPPAK